MSPEHFFDFKRADQRADVYSLGKILFEAVDGKINSGTTPFRNAKLAETESPFFQELDRIIQMATAENRDERTKTVKDLLGQLERVIHGLGYQKEPTKSALRNATSWFSQPKWLMVGIIVAVLSVILMTSWHFMDEPGLKILSDSFSQDSAQHGILITASPEILDGSFVSEHIGKQIFIPGGKFTIAETSEGGTGQSAQVKPFHMDEFFVTNLQFADFLNHNLPKIKINGGVVKNGNEVLFLLGEVRSGYKPIIYRRGKFHIADPTYASSPVLRVTGYGALAFSKFLGRRLPTEMEMLFAMVKGADSSKLDEEPSAEVGTQPMGGMMGMMGDWQGEDWNSAPPTQKPSAKDNTEPMSSGFLLSATSFTPNLLGIKGLNHEIGEWVYTQGQGHPPADASKTNRYAVIGGVEGAPKDKNSLPAVVERFPWEGFEEIGFRTVKNAAVDNSVE
jgi:serine/threonine-protein kinase